MSDHNFDYTEILRDLTGKDKLDMLDVIQFGEEKLRDLQKENPLLFQCIRLFNNSPKDRPMIRSFLTKMAEVHRCMVEYVEAHVEQSKSIQKLTSEGWYFSIEFIDFLGISNLAEHLERDSVAFEADVLAEFEQRASHIKRKLIEASPKRAHLIRNIFELHGGENYYGAIPLALTQADGFSKDWFTVTNKQGQQVSVGFFASEFEKKGVPGAQLLSRSFNLSETSIFNILVSQLAKTDRNNSLILEANTLRLSDLNRHAVIHGESVDFGTKTNSVKAILLLDFIADLQMTDSILKEKLKTP